MTPGRRRPLPARKSLKRAVGTRLPKKTIAVWCEGTRSEPQYLEALRNEPAVKDVASVDIRIEARDEGAVPLTLVRSAMEQRRRTSIEKGEIDEFWCVFDVEWPKHHPNLTEALDLARRNSIKVAVSNPCFEVWLIFHFRNQTGFLNNDEARRGRRACDLRDDKSLDASLYMPRRAHASQHAAALDTMHRDNGTSFPNNNPSSGMHRLLKSLGT